MTEQTPMTQEQLNAIQERVDAATRGPWAHDFCGNVDQVETQAHAPQDLTDLLAEVERLRDFESIVSWRYGDTTDGKTREDMIERAAMVMCTRTTHPGAQRGWDRATPAAKDAWWEDARAALDAALGTGEGA